MKVALFFKIFVMTAALVGVIWVIRSLSSDKVEHAMGALGVENPAPPTLKATASAAITKLSICPTRIHAVEFAGGHKVEEQKQGVKVVWLAYDPKPREISTLDVEKWLSRHCMVEVREIGPAVGHSYGNDAKRTAVTLHYVDGRQSVLERSGPDGFSIEGQNYLSKELADALAELESIAQFPGTESP